MITIQIDDKSEKKIKSFAQRRGRTVEEYVLFSVQNQALWDEIEESEKEPAIPLHNPEDLLKMKL